MNPSFSAPNSRFDAVICDIDGCLLPETSDPMDAPALARIAEHNRLAHQRRDRPLVTLCSGRPQPFVEAMARLLGVRTLPSVAENGVWIYHPQVRWHGRPARTNPSGRDAHATESEHGRDARTAEEHTTHTYEIDPSITEDHLAAVEHARAWVRRLGPLGVVMQPGKTASISLYHPDTDLLMGLMPRIGDAFASENWPLRLSTTWYYINCDLEHVSKATALDRVIAHAGLDPARLAGVGDTESDHAIADRVGFFACPANAREDIKARAAYISPHEQVEGVLDILGQL